MYKVHHIDAYAPCTLGTYKFDSYGEAVQFMNTFANGDEFDSEYDSFELYRGSEQLKVYLKTKLFVNVGA